MPLVMANDLQEKIKLKTFHCEIINDNEALNWEQKSFKELPLVRHINQAAINENYFRIKKEVEELIEHEIEVLSHGFN